jgi:hypothetical protein
VLLAARSQASSDGWEKVSNSARRTARTIMSIFSIVTPFAGKSPMVAVLTLVRVLGPKPTKGRAAALNPFASYLRSPLTKKVTERASMSTSTRTESLMRNQTPPLMVLPSALRSPALGSTKHRVPCNSSGSTQSSGMLSSATPTSTRSGQCPMRSEMEALPLRMS